MHYRDPCGGSRSACAASHRMPSLLSSRNLSYSRITMSREQLSYLKELGIDWYVPRTPRGAGVEPQTSRRPGEVPLLDWDTLQHRVAGCTLCGLEKTRTQTVFGVGNRQAEWMVIG